MRAAAAALAVVVAVIALALALPRKGASHRQAPALPTRSLQGPAVTLASLRGRPALVNFFASWCTPCAREAPSFQRAYTELRARVGVVAVDVSDASSNARRFLVRYGWTAPVLEDPEGLVGDSYGLAGLPTTFVLDAHGRILRRLTGPQTTASLVAAVRAA